MEVRLKVERELPFSGKSPAGACVSVKKLEEEGRGMEKE
jgi:hypothetical protein